MRLIASFGAAIAVTGCGRLDFDATAPRDGHVDGRLADAIDAPGIDALAELVVVVDPGPHHVGDTAGPAPPMNPEGPSISDPFQMTVTCTTATLEVELTGPFGPNRAKMPTIEIDGIDLGSVRSFFPPDADPRWGSGGDYDGNPPVETSLPCTLALGANTFFFASGNPTDDIYFDHVQIRCELPH